MCALFRGAFGVCFMRTLLQHFDQAMLHQAMLHQAMLLPNEDQHSLVEMLHG